MRIKLFSFEPKDGFEIEFGYENPRPGTIRCYFTVVTPEFDGL